MTVSFWNPVALWVSEFRIVSDQQLESADGAKMTMVSRENDWGYSNIEDENMCNQVFSQFLFKGWNVFGA